jgi:hypothetical protein
MFRESLELSNKEAIIVNDDVFFVSCIARFKGCCDVWGEDFELGLASERFSDAKGTSSVSKGPKHSALFYKNKGEIN